MRKVNYPEQIKESLPELKALAKALDCSKIKDRLEVLIWLKTEKVKTMKEAISLKGKSKSQGQRWWQQYKKEGIESYLCFKHEGQISPLSGKEELENRLNNEGFDSINEARLWILETYGIIYTENGLGNYFRHHKIKLKTGRPHHPKKNDGKRAAFKKNMKKN